MAVGAVEAGNAAGDLKSLQASIDYAPAASPWAAAYTVYVNFGSEAGVRRIREYPRVSWTLVPHDQAGGRV